MVNVCWGVYLLLVVIVRARGSGCISNDDDGGDSSVWDITVANIHSDFV